MAKIKNKQNIPFTQVANTVLNDARLTLKAKGMFAYLFSKPDGWDFSSNRMVQDHKEGRKSMMSALRELELYNYLRRSRLPDGKMDYILAYSDDIELQFPEGTKGGYTLSSQRAYAQREPIKNKEEKNKEILEKGENKILGERTESKVQENTIQENKKIAEMIELFRPVNPMINNLFKRKPEWDAVKRMLTIFTGEVLTKRIKALEQTNKMPYFPTITSPLELERNMGKLESKIYQEQTKIQNQKPKIAIIS